MRPGSASVQLSHPPTGSPTDQVVARSVADIVAARGVKPSLSPNLNTLALVESLGIKRLLFIGVGCQVKTFGCCCCCCCVLFLRGVGCCCVG